MSAKVTIKDETRSLYLPVHVTACQIKRNVSAIIDEFQQIHDSEQLSVSMAQKAYGQPNALGMPTFPVRLDMQLAIGGSTRVKGRQSRNRCESYLHSCKADGFTSLAK